MINHFIIVTVDMINKSTHSPSIMIFFSFGKQVEIKMQKLEQKIETIDNLLLILEEKIDSIPKKKLPENAMPSNLPQQQSNV